MKFAGSADRVIMLGDCTPNGGTVRLLIGEGPHGDNFSELGELDLAPTGGWTTSMRSAGTPYQSRMRPATTVALASQRWTRGAVARSQRRSRAACQPIRPRSQAGLRPK